MAVAEFNATTTKAEKIGLLDRAAELSTKLDALLMMTCGEGGESLRCLNDELQDAYMWACSGLAAELKECITKLN